LIFIIFLKITVDKYIFDLSKKLEHLIQSSSQVVVGGNKKKVGRTILLIFSAHLYVIISVQYNIYDIHF